MSISLVRCKECKKQFGFNVYKKCNVCHEAFSIDLCIQCHNQQNHRFIPLAQKYHINRYRSPVFGIQFGLFTILSIAFFYSVKMVVNI